jgi:hypothetical protein
VNPAIGPPFGRGLRPFARKDSGLGVVRALPSGVRDARQGSYCAYSFFVASRPTTMPMIAHEGPPMVRSKSLK